MHEHTYTYLLKEKNPHDPRNPYKIRTPWTRARAGLLRARSTQSVRATNTKLVCWRAIRTCVFHCCSDSCPRDTPNFLHQSYERCHNKPDLSVAGALHNPRLLLLSVNVMAHFMHAVMDSLAQRPGATFMQPFTGKGGLYSWDLITCKQYQSDLEKVAGHYHRQLSSAGAKPGSVVGLW